MSLWTPEMQRLVDQDIRDRKLVDSLLAFEQRKLVTRPYQRPSLRPVIPYRYNPDTQTVEIDIR